MDCVIVPSNAYVGLLSSLNCCMPIALGHSSLSLQKMQFFVNKSQRSGLCDNELEDFDTLCAASDKRLCNTILNRPDHVLHPILPPHNASKYQLCSRPHSRWQLRRRTSRLTDCNFIARWLHRDMYWLFIVQTWLVLCLCLVLKCVSCISFIKLLIDWSNRIKRPIRIRIESWIFAGPHSPVACTL